MRSTVREVHKNKLLHTHTRRVAISGSLRGGKLLLCCARVALLLLNHLHQLGLVGLELIDTRNEAADRRLLVRSDSRELLLPLVLRFEELGVFGAQRVAVVNGRLQRGLRLRGGLLRLALVVHQAVDCRLRGLVGAAKFLLQVCVLGDEGDVLSALARQRSLKLRHVIASCVRQLEGVRDKRR